MAPSQVKGWPRGWGQSRRNQVLGGACGPGGGIGVRKVPPAGASLAAGPDLALWLWVSCRTPEAFADFLGCLLLDLSSFPGSLSPRGQVWRVGLWSPKPVSRLRSQKSAAWPRGPQGSW